MGWLIDGLLKILKMNLTLHYLVETRVFNLTVRHGQGDEGLEKSLHPGGGMGKVFNGGLWAIVRTEYRIFTLCRRSPRDIRGYQTSLQTSKQIRCQEMNWTRLGRRGDEWVTMHQYMTHSNNSPAREALFFKGAMTGFLEWRPALNYMCGKSEVYVLWP